MQASRLMRSLFGLYLVCVSNALWVSAVGAQICPPPEVHAGGIDPECVKPGGGHPFRDCPECPQLVVVPSGVFTMGSRPHEEVAAEREDQVSVRINRPFAVGRYAVTRAEFAAFLRASGHQIPQGGGTASMAQNGSGTRAVGGGPGSSRTIVIRRLALAGTMQVPMSLGSHPQPVRTIASSRRRSASTLPAQGRRHHSGGVQRFQLTKQTMMEGFHMAMVKKVNGVRVPFRLKPSNVIPGACTMCMAMSGNGWRIVGMLTTPVASVMVQRG